jgi:hypothetical protein
MDRRGPEPGTQLYDYLASPWLPAVTLKQPWHVPQPSHGGVLGVPLLGRPSSFLTPRRSMS